MNLEDISKIISDKDGVLLYFTREKGWLWFGPLPLNGKFTRFIWINHFPKLGGSFSLGY